MEVKHPQYAASEISRTSGWTSARFSAYLDLQADEEDGAWSLIRTLDTAEERDDSDALPGES